jgi:isopentenyl-diphosphate delta-isomerase
LDSGLTEHEIDHVFVGTYNGPIHPNKEEVGDYAYLDIDYLQAHIEKHPDQYTVWFKIAVPILRTHMLKSTQ